MTLYLIINETILIVSIPWNEENEQTLRIFLWKMTRYVDWYIKEYIILCNQLIIVIIIKSFNYIFKTFEEILFHSIAIRHSLIFFPVFPANVFRTIHISREIFFLSTKEQRILLMRLLLDK